tara:strand:- start:21363 stop:23015 length:1653 start_codon:yes stop_codon:yes gene_type:complete
MDIQELFDKQFYNEYYACTSNVSEYIQDCIHDGRYIHPAVIEDNFDYGVFISELNWSDIILVNQYHALEFYLKHREKYKYLFNQKHTDVKFDKLDSSEICCVYVVKKTDEISKNIALESIEKIKHNVDRIYIILPESLKDEEIFNKTYHDYIVDIKDIWTLKKISNKYKYTLFANNDICINDYLCDFLNDFDEDVKSVCDVYHNYNNRFYRCVNPNLLLIKNKILIKILKTIRYNFNINLCYSLTNFLKQQNISYKYYAAHTQVKEVFWYNLFGLKLLDYQTLVDNLKIPCVSSWAYETMRQNLHNCFLNGTSIKSTSIIDNLKSSVKTYDKSHSIACHIHIGNTNPRILDSIQTAINKLNYFNTTYFITSNTKIDNMKTFILPNKGADIGPFLYILYHYILKDNYDFIVKLHSKTHHGFRDICFDTILNNMLYTQYILTNKHNCYIAGPQQKNMMLDTVNQPIIDNFCKEYNIDIDSSKIDFFAGTMFVCKHKMFNEFIEKYKVNLLDHYLTLETGYRKNHQPTYTHSWERILSGIIPYSLQSSKLYII